MADYLKLFHEHRLSVDVPHHLEYIKGRLANLKIEDPKAYDEYSAHYGVDIDVHVKKEPAKETPKEEPKKRGRPSKS